MKNIHFWRKSIRAKLMLVFLLLSLLPAILVGYLAFEKAKSSLEEEVTGHLTSVVTLKGQEVNQWFKEEAEDIENLSISPYLVENYVCLLRQTQNQQYTSPSCQKLRDFLKEWLGEGGDFSEFFLMDLEGKIIVSTDSEQEGKYKSNRPYFIEGKESLFIQNVYHSLTFSEPAITIATPLSDEGGEVVGVVAGRANLATLSEIMDEYSGLGKTGNTYLVNKYNFFVTEPRFGNGYALKKAIHTEAVKECLEYKSGTGLYYDYQGKRVLGAYMWMAERELGLFAEMNQSEAFGLVYSLRSTVLLILTGVIVIVTLLGLLMSTRITKPIRRLATGALAIGKGDFSHKVKLDSEDELGQLANSFNKMAEELQNTTISKDYMNNIIGSMLDALIVLDLDAKIRTVNKATCELLVYGEEELIGMPVGTISAVLEETLLNATEMDKLIKEEGLMARETDFEAKDGRKVPVLLSSSVMKDEDGKVICVVCTARDITERKQAEETLQRSEKRYKFLYENSPSVNLIIGIDGIVKDINSLAFEKVGYAKDEIIGQPALDFIAPEDREEVAALLELSFRDEYTPETEIDIYGKDGAIHTVLFSPSQGLLYEEGQVSSILVTGIDITERKRAEEKLRESEEKYRSLTNDVLDSSAVGIFILDSDFKIVWVNRALERYFGIRREDIIGIDKRNLIRDRVKYVFADPEGFAQTVLATYDNNTYVENFECLVLPDGERKERWLEHWSQPIATGLYAGGRIEHYTDITERKQAEERENQLQQEVYLSSRLASIGQMASGVAHEINNPLTSVVGFSQLLLRRDLPEDMRKRLETINNEAQRVAKIVENLLTFARRHKPGQEYIDINEVISQTLELRSYEMRANNIQLVTKLSPELLRTVADPGQLQQVFLNIVLNAEKAMKDEHGRGTLVVKTERIQNIIRASFTDDGPGISKENLDKIFDPFFTTREVGNGTGLGLSICYGVVAQHKGKLYAQSELGKGATFFVELPIVSKGEQQNDTEATTGEALSPRSGAKILVIDDERSVLDFLSSLLTEEGYQMETTDRANVALEKLKRQEYDLLLLDIKMPGMSGIELYRHIEATNPALAQRVLFITGDIMELDTTEFLKRTKAPYITKPLKIERLTKEINRILKRNQR